MKRGPLLSSLFLSLIVSAAQAQAPKAPQPIYTDKDLALAKQAMAAAQSSDLAWDVLASLTTEVGPRSAGSPNDARAVAWAKAKLETLGFDKVWIEPVKVDAWARISGEASIVSPYPQPMAVAALGNSISTPAKGLSAEVAYYENFDALKNDTSERAKGRIVFIDTVFPHSRDGRGYGQGVAGRFRGAVEAGKRGAVAVLIRSVGSDHDRLPHTGAMRYDEKIAPPIPAAAVSNPDADLVVREVKSGQPVRIALNLQNKFTKDQPSANVLAEIRGTDKPEQIVAIGGHLDSWDLGTGAIDDGAGVAITVGALKAVRDLGVRPKRTIRVVLFANEENGLDGGNAYAEVHGKERHQLLGESDLGAGKIYRFATSADPSSLPWLRAMADVVAPLGVEFGEGGESGADVGPIIRQHGYPSVSLAQDATLYFDYHHTANDTLDKVEPAALKQNVSVWAAVIWLAAQADADFVAAPRKQRE